MKKVIINYQTYANVLSGQDDAARRPSKYTIPPLVARPARTTPAVSGPPINAAPARPTLPYRPDQLHTPEDPLCYRHLTHLDHKGAGSGALVNAGQVLRFLEDRRVVVDVQDGDREEHVTCKRENWPKSHMTVGDGGARQNILMENHQTFSHKWNIPLTRSATANPLMNSLVKKLRIKGLLKLAVYYLWNRCTFANPLN
jgi:hypothetical protein